MAFLFGKKKGNHRDGPPPAAAPGATFTPVSTPPSSLNNSLNSLAGGGDGGSPGSRAPAPNPNVVPRSVLPAPNPDAMATPPGTSQGRGPPPQVRMLQFVSCSFFLGRISYVGLNCRSSYLLRARNNPPRAAPHCILGRNAG
jgi:hypothetical protein